MNECGEDNATVAVRNARGLLAGFENADTEERYGAIEHAIHELYVAQRELPDDY